mmetsp:Transcript_41477/g.125633  ORF Transcript_41477/g.125633 Transcript_41477/m.125633 type:complete len:401 (-) Transcript_41477:1558-2760(-)
MGPDTSNNGTLKGYTEHCRSKNVIRPAGASLAICTIDDSPVDPHGIDPLPAGVALLLGVTAVDVLREAGPRASIARNVLGSVGGYGLAVRVDLLRPVHVQLEQSDREELHDLPCVILVRIESPPVTIEGILHSLVVLERQPHSHEVAVRHLPQDVAVVPERVPYEGVVVVGPDLGLAIDPLRDRDGDDLIQCPRDALTELIGRIEGEVRPEVLLLLVVIPVYLAVVHGPSAVFVGGLDVESVNVADGDVAPDFADAPAHDDAVAVGVDGVRGDVALDLGVRRYLGGEGAERGFIVELPHRGVVRHRGREILVRSTRRREGPHGGPSDEGFDGLTVAVDVPGQIVHVEMRGVDVPPARSRRTLHVSQVRGTLVGDVAPGAVSRNVLEAGVVILPVVPAIVE